MRNPDLNSAQKAILFDKATEPPFSGSLLHVNDDGIYECANCHQHLFDSSAKFDSGCGWPSFDRAIEDSVTFTLDNSHSMERTELTCSNCGGHLGHIFDDGPLETTGKRYCVNSLSLDFKKK